MPQSNPNAVFRSFSWNCRGIGQPSTVSLLKTFSIIHKPDFIFLSETLTSFSNCNSTLTSLNYPNCFGVDSIGKSGGLWIGFASNVIVEPISLSTNFMLFKISLVATSPWFLGCIYGNPHLSKRADTWAQITNSLNPFCNKSIFITGDFDQVLLSSEKSPLPNPISKVPRNFSLSLTILI